MNKLRLLAGIGVFLILALVIGVSLLKRSRTPSTVPQVPDISDRRNLLVKDDSYQRGDPKVPVTIVEFVDLQCGACAYVNSFVQAILGEYGGKVKLVVRYWPLAQHKNAKAAIYAAEAAGECPVGRFWEMYDRILENQSQWSQSDDPWNIFVGYAKDLDCDGFPTDFQTTSSKFAAKVARDLENAGTLSVKSVPVFFINGVNYGYLQSYNELKDKVETELAFCDQTTMTEDDIDNGRLLCSSI